MTDWMALAACTLWLAVSAGPPEVRTLPADRGGQDRVGTRFEALPLERVLNHSERKTPARATLYRWWTEDCPFCRSSLPAVEKLRNRYEAEGLAVVAVYHPKPRRSVTDAHVLGWGARLGYHGAVAIDEDWTALHRAYLVYGERNATSVTFLVDADGVTRFVHPGPEFFPSDRRKHAQADADFRALENAIRVLLRVPDEE